MYYLRINKNLVHQVGAQTKVISIQVTACNHVVKLGISIGGHRTNNALVPTIIVAVTSFSCNIKVP
jgi:hypothetical protein